MSSAYRVNTHQVDRQPKTLMQSCKGQTIDNIGPHRLTRQVRRSGRRTRGMAEASTKCLRVHSTADSESHFGQVEFRQAPGGSPQGHGVRSVGKLCGDTHPLRAHFVGARHSAEADRPRRRGDCASFPVLRRVSPELAQMRGANCIVPCPMLRAKRKTCAHIEFFSV